MLLTRLLLDTLVLPAPACAVAFWIVRGIGGKSDPSRSAAAAVGLGMGYLTGHLRILGPPPLPPVDTTQWLFYVVILSVAAGLWRGIGARWGTLAAAIPAAGLLSATLRPMWTYHWGGGEAAIWGAGLFAALLLLWLSQDRLASVSPEGPQQSLVFLWVALAVSAVLGLSATALLAMLAAALAVGLGVLALISFFSRVPSGGWRLVAFAVLAGLLLNGLFYAQLTGWNAALLAVAPAAAWLSRAPWIRRQGPWVRIAAALLAVILVTVPAVADAALAYLRESPYDY
jgi:hypothetical protein